MQRLSSDKPNTRRPIRCVFPLRQDAKESGGQRQKLATTCLAAALRYQLGGADSQLPSYAAVVLDRAERRTKSGSKMGIVQLSDTTGQFEAILFQEGLNQYRDDLEKGAAVLVTEIPPALGRKFEIGRAHV